MEINKLFTTIDAHTAGEPLRIITGGLPYIKGDTMLERRAYFREHFDDIRRILMYEPRGHHGMYGCVMTPPVSLDADFGVLFMHNEGFSTMCGHGIIAVVTAAIETGLFRKKDGDSKVIIDTPAGKVIAQAECEESEVLSVTFENVPSFVYASDVPVHLPEAQFTVDIAFGGAFYAIVKAEDIGVNVQIEQLAQLQKLGRDIKKHIESHMLIQHPKEKELQGIYGVIISDKPDIENAHKRNVTIFADEQVDRSPCGTGTCATMAVLHHRGELQIREQFVHESIINSQLTGEIMSIREFEGYKAIVPTIKGRASITGLHKFVVDPSDPLASGFLLS